MQAARWSRMGFPFSSFDLGPYLPQSRRLSESGRHGIGSEALLFEVLEERPACAEITDEIHCWNGPCFLTPASKSRHLGFHSLPALKTHSHFPPAPLIRIELCAGDFATNWLQCDRVANYLARTVSSDRPDTFLHSNLLSTALNELFEIAFSQHRADGRIVCELSRNGEVDHVALTIPVEAAQRAYFHRQVGYVHSGNVADLYARALLGEAAPDTAVGLLELAADYGATISLNDLPDETHVQLVVDIPLNTASAA